MENEEKNTQKTNRRNEFGSWREKREDDDDKDMKKMKVDGGQVKLGVYNNLWSARRAYQRYS